MDNEQLKKGIALAEKRLTEISEISFQMLDENIIQDVDIYNKVYKINQCTHDALGPIHKYCLDEHSSHDN
jgi:hypothetical protein